MTYEEFSNIFYQRMQDAGIHEPLVVFASYASDPDRDDMEDNVVSNLDEVAVKGLVQFFEDHDSFWGPGTDYLSDVVMNPTWMQVAIFADEMIKITGDRHHVFLEGIREAEPKAKAKHLRFSRSTYRDRKKDPRKGAKMYTFMMGS